MTPVLVDTNVVLDVASHTSDWKSWSMAALARSANEGPVLINSIIYAELSPGYRSQAEVDRLLDEVGLDREDIPWSAAFLAGRAYESYRRRGGDRRSPLPDFFIGAHAAVKGYALLTRDGRRYRTYFPTVQLITPESA